MKKKAILILLILTAAIAVVVFKPSLAWFTENGADMPQEVNLGVFDISLVKGVDISAAYTAGSDSYVAPGENMIYVETTPLSGVLVPGQLSVKNKSTILTNIRVKIMYTYISGGVPSQVVYDNTPQTDFTVDFDMPADWTYDAATECWNYLPGGNPVPAATDLVNGDEIVLINSIGYSNLLEPGNDYEDETVTVTLKVEAKQAEYATWIQVSP